MAPIFSKPINGLYLKLFLVEDTKGGIGGIVIISSEIFIIEPISLYLSLIIGATLLNNLIFFRNSYKFFLIFLICSL